MPAPIIVKFLEKSSLTAPGHRDWWRRQLPADGRRWGQCRFDFDPACRNYDWLVVYDDLPVVPPSNRHQYIEELACPQENTLFVTAEPSSIKTYGSAFLDQFGTVLTSHEPWALKHAHVIRSQPALRWHYGVDMDTPDREPLTYDRMASTPPMAKSRLISTVCSSKRMRMTMHARRYDFSMQAAREIRGMDLFGYGIRRIRDKREALDDYRYHLAIENHIGPHHWTEKLADAFLAYTLPFYFGAPNASEYFPEESFIAIDIRQPEQAIGQIRRAIDADAYSQRIEAILEARRRVLERYNLFAVIDGLIAQSEPVPTRKSSTGRIMSRHLARKAGPLVATHYLAELGASRTQYLVRRWLGVNR